MALISGSTHRAQSPNSMQNTTLTSLPALKNSPQNLEQRPKIPNLNLSMNFINNDNLMHLGLHKNLTERAGRKREVQLEMKKHQSPPTLNSPCGSQKHERKWDYRLDRKLKDLEFYYSGGPTRVCHMKYLDDHPSDFSTAEDSPDTKSPRSRKSTKKDNKLKMTE